MVEISIVGDVVPGAEEPAAGAVAEVERLFALAEALPEDELDAGVHERRGFCLCGGCRQDFRRDPLGLKEPQVEGWLH